MILESDQLTASAAKLVDVPNHIWSSLKEQRKEDILCDAIIKCGDDKHRAHRSVLYAISPYCRKILQGSFKAEVDNGIVLIELDDFPPNIVKLFVNIIYGEHVLEVSDIDVEELLKLFDFLQADSYIDILTEILRKLLNIDNCLELYQLSLKYNCQKLKRVILSYISCYLESVIKSDFWKQMSESTLLSLLKNPLIRSQPLQLVGVAASEHYSGIVLSNMLLGYTQKYLSPTTLSHVACAFGNCDEEKVRQHKIELPGHRETCYYCFTFRQELYVIATIHKKGNHRVFKYQQNSKDYVPVSTLFKCIGMVNNNWPSLVITSYSFEHVFIVFHDARGSVQVLSMKYGKEAFSIHEYFLIDTSVNFTNFLEVYNKKEQSIYFFSGANLHIYNLNSRALIVRSAAVEDIEMDLDHQLYSYEYFDGKIYFIRFYEDNIQFYTYNNEGFCWDFLCGYPTEHKIVRVCSASSCNEFFVVVENDLDGLDYIYQFDTDTREMPLLRTTNAVKNSYCFVPETIFD